MHRLRTISSAGAPGSRRGTVYVLVLATVMIVTVLGVAGVLSVRVMRRQESLGSDAAGASALAQAALELACRNVSDSVWRTKYGDGLWLDEEPLGDGVISIEAFDPDDDDVRDDPSDTLRIIATGAVGQARQMLAADFEASPTGMSCLQTAATSGLGIAFDSATVAADAPIAVTGNAFASSSTVAADVEATGSISGSAYKAATTAGADARELPDPIDIISIYTAKAVTINYASLSGGEIDRQLLGPGVNPYGTSSATGTYVIDCKNQDLRIRRSRIVGTLIILDPGSSSVIEDSTLIQPADDDVPTIIVRGTMNFSLKSDSLTESDVGKNLNPSGIPYKGSTDSDTFDSYPSGIEGLVYVTDHVSFENESILTGVLIAGQALRFAGDVEITHDPKFVADPPEGFSTWSMQLVPGSIARVVE